MLKKISFMLVLLFLSCNKANLNTSMVGSTTVLREKPTASNLENGSVSLTSLALNEGDFIKPNDYFEIRLIKFISHQPHDGKKEEISEGSYKSNHIDNEYGIFLTVRTLPREDDINTLINSPQNKDLPNISNRLVYSSFERKPGQPIQVLNLPVYYGKYDGNDFNINISVKEFDTTSKKNFKNIIKSITKINNTIPHPFEPYLGDDLNELGENLSNNIFKDDLVMSYDVYFVNAPKSLTNIKKQYYFQSGYLVFARHRENKTYGEIELSKNMIAKFEGKELGFYAIFEIRKLEAPSIKNSSSDGASINKIE